MHVCMSKSERHYTVVVTLTILLNPWDDPLFLFCFFLGFLYGLGIGVRRSTTHSVTPMAFLSGIQ